MYNGIRRTYYINERVCVSEVCVTDYTSVCISKNEKYGKFLCVLEKF